MGPICLSFLSIESQPLEKTFVNGTVSVFAHIYTAIDSIVVQAMADKYPKNPIGAIWFSAGSCAIGAILIALARPDKTRLLKIQLDS